MLAGLVGGMFSDSAQFDQLPVRDIQTPAVSTSRHEINVQKESTTESGDGDVIKRYRLCLLVCSLVDSVSTTFAYIHVHVR